METKRIVSSALVLVILLAFCCTPIMAAEPAGRTEQAVAYFSDGSYLVTTLEIEDTAQRLPPQAYINAVHTAPEWA